MNRFELRLDAFPRPGVSCRNLYHGNLVPLGLAPVHRCLASNSIVGAFNVVWSVPVISAVSLISSVYATAAPDLLPSHPNVAD